MKTNTLYIAFSIAAFLFVAVNANGQARYFDERYITTQHYVNPVLVNPGAVGSSEYHRIIGNYRNNWASFPGAPKSFWASYDGNLGNRIGVGLLVLTDSNASLRTTKGQGTISYNLNTSNNNIGFGLSGEFVQHGVNSGELGNILNSPDDQIYLQRLDGINFFDISFGVYGVYDGKVKYGLSLPSLASSRLDERESTFDKEFGYIFHVGYDWDVAGYDFSFEPSIFIKQLAYVPFHVDINVLGKFLDERLLGGFTYTVGADERLGFLIGARVNSLSLNYSYNLSRNGFQSYNNGAHELSIKFELGRSDKKEVMLEEDDMIKEMLEKEHVQDNMPKDN